MGVRGVALAAGVAALAVLLWLGRGFIAASAATYDEPIHLSSGYLTLRASARLPLARYHPILCEAWAALPLLSLRPSSMTMAARSLWYDHADLFLYKNSVDAEKMLNRSRLWMLSTWSALLMAVVVAWALALGGVVAAICAAGLLAFFPPWLSNAPLVTTDAGCTALYALSFWLLAGPARPPARMLAAGAALGLALAAKFSMVVAPVFALAALIAERRFPGPKRPLTTAAGIACLCAGALAALTMVYWRYGLSLYWDGASNTLFGLSQGRASFLYGHHSVTGSVLYFPVAFLIKTPLPVLLLSAGALFYWLRHPAREHFWVAFPAAAFFAAACFSKTQIGYRHILPVYPFLLVMSAWSCAKLWGLRYGKALVVALLAWQAAGAVGTQPHQLAYFNELIGGPERGHEFLVDSNLDWGQDLKALAAEVKRRGNPAIYLSYFGSADPSYYGLRYLPLAFVSNIERREGVAKPPAAGPVLLAVSATNLQGVYFADHEIFAWLKQRTPVFTAGHSIFLYDLTRDPEGRKRLEALISLQYPNG